MVDEVDAIGVSSVALDMVVGRYSVGVGWLIKLILYAR